MKNKLFIAGLLLLISAVCFSACTRNNIQDLVGAQGCDTTATTYMAEIKPILDANCNTSGCHDAASKQGGYNLEDYATLQPAALGNKFLATIRHEAGFSPMPKGGVKLDECQIKKIEIWVSKGARNN